MAYKLRILLNWGEREVEWWTNPNPLPHKLCPLPGNAIWGRSLLQVLAPRFGPPTPPFHPPPPPALPTPTHHHLFLIYQTKIGHYERPITFHLPADDSSSSTKCKIVLRNSLVTASLLLPLCMGAFWKDGVFNNNSIFNESYLLWKLANSALAFLHLLLASFQLLRSNIKRKQREPSGLCSHPKSQPDDFSTPRKTNNLCGSEPLLTSLPTRIVTNTRIGWQKVTHCKG